MEHEYLGKKTERETPQEITLTFTEKQKAARRLFNESKSIIKDNNKKRTLMEEAISMDNTQQDINYSYLSLIKKDKDAYAKSINLLHTLSSRQIQKLNPKSAKPIKDNQSQLDRLFNTISTTDWDPKENPLEEWLNQTALKDHFESNQPITLLSNPELFYYSLIEAIHYYAGSIAAKGNQIGRYCDLLTKQLLKPNMFLFNYLFCVFTTEEYNNLLDYLTFDLIENIKPQKQLSQIFDKEKYQIDNDIVKVQLNSYDTASFDLNHYSLNLISRYRFIASNKEHLNYYCQNIQYALHHHYYADDMNFIKDCILSIVNSNTIRTHYSSGGNSSNISYPFTSEKFLDELWSHIIFVPFHSLILRGVTDPKSLDIYINSMPRMPSGMGKIFHIKNSFIGLINLGSVMLTMIRQIVGHYLRRYLTLASSHQCNLSFHSQADEQNADHLVDKALFGEIIQDVDMTLVFYILSKRNWEQSIDIFRQKWQKLKSRSSEKQLKYIRENDKEELHLLLSKYCIDLNDLTTVRLLYVKLSMNGNNKNSHYLGHCGIEINRLLKSLRRNTDK